MAAHFQRAWGGDYNGDGLFTISDFWQLAGRAALYPGDLFVMLLYKWNSVGAFLVRVAPLDRSRKPPGNRRLLIVGQ